MTQEDIEVRPNSDDVNMSEGREAKEDGSAAENKETESEDVEGEEISCEQCEAAPIKVARDPGDPTSEEMEQHWVTHLPYRPWCPVCV